MKDSASQIEPLNSANRVFVQCAPDEKAPSFLKVYRAREERHKKSQSLDSKKDFVFSEEKSYYSKSGPMVKSKEILSSGTMR